MRKPVKFTYILSLWVIGLFTLGMFMTFFNEWLQNTGFFGDVLLKTVRNTSNDVVTIDVMHDWGARHYWYWWMCVMLFILSVVRIFVWGANYLEEPKTKLKS